MIHFFKSTIIVSIECGGVGLIFISFIYFSLCVNFYFLFHFTVKALADAVSSGLLDKLVVSWRLDPQPVSYSTCKTAHTI